MQRSPDLRCSFESQQGGYIKNSRSEEVSLGLEKRLPGPEMVWAPGPLVW